MTRRCTSLLMAVAVFVGSACSVSETLRLPSCSSDSSTVLISAQSVPTAAYVVCFDTIPTGWEVDEVNIGNNGTHVVFHSDRAGDSAAIFHYEAACDDLGDATPTPTDYDQTTRFEWIIDVDSGFRANRYYRFDGGCVTWQFDFDADAPAALSVELGNALQLFDRETVNADFRANFVDEDL